MRTPISIKTKESLPIESRKLQILRALTFATWMYSSLFLVYLSIRVLVNHAPLNDPFIWDILPFFTFFITGIILLVICSLSMGMYLAIRVYSKPLTKVNREASILRVSFFIIWMFSLFTWAGISSIIVYNDEMVWFLVFHSHPGFPLWVIGIWMFGISFISLVIFIAVRNPFGSRDESNSR